MSDGHRIRPPGYRLLSLLALLPVASTLVPAGTGRVAQRTAQLRRSAALMRQAGADSAGGIVDGVRIGPPPDMPSLLLNNRIVYLGMPISASVRSSRAAHGSCGAGGGPV